MTGKVGDAYFGDKLDIPRKGFLSGFDLVTSRAKDTDWSTRLTEDHKDDIHFRNLVTVVTDPITGEPRLIGHDQLFRQTVARKRRINELEIELLKKQLPAKKRKQIEREIESLKSSRGAQRVETCPVVRLMASDGDNMTFVGAVTYDDVTGTISDFIPTEIRTVPSGRLPPSGSSVPQIMVANEEIKECMSLRGLPATFLKTGEECIPEQCLEAINEHQRRWSEFQANADVRLESFLKAMSDLAIKASGKAEKDLSVRSGVVSMSSHEIESLLNQNASVSGTSSRERDFKFRQTRTQLYNTIKELLRMMIAREHKTATSAEINEIFTTKYMRDLVKAADIGNKMTSSGIPVYQGDLNRSVVILKEMEAFRECASNMLNDSTDKTEKGRCMSSGGKCTYIPSTSNMPAICFPDTFSEQIKKIPAGKDRTDIAKKAKTAAVEAVAEAKAKKEDELAHLYGGEAVSKEEHDAVSELNRYLQQVRKSRMSGGATLEELADEDSEEDSDYVEEDALYGGGGGGGGGSDAKDSGYNKSHHKGSMYWSW